MQADKEHIDELIASFLSREIGSEGLDELQRWIAASDENRTYFLREREVWFSAIDRRETSRYDKGRAFSRFRERVAAEEGATTRTICFTARWMRHIAVAAVLVAVAALAYWQGGVSVKNHFADITVEAPMGSKTKLHLPDGTLVWLNAGSRIVYSQGFGVDNRRVSLEGEGYFEVMHDESVPFYVETHDLQVRVLGTKFNFRDYPDDREVVVSLLEGKVALHNLLKEGDEAFLSPDERVILDKQSREMKIEAKQAGLSSQWTNGCLSFDERLLTDIVKELERSYGVSIRIVTPRLKTFRFYGTFFRQEQSIREVMDALASTGELHYRFESQRTILIY